MYYICKSYYNNIREVNMAISGDMIQINSRTTIDVCRSVASKVKARRLEMNLTQTGLAVRAGVNIETYRKFERTGEVSLHNLVKLAFSLDSIADFNGLFDQKQYQTLDNLLSTENINRKRGTKK